MLTSQSRLCPQQGAQQVQLQYDGKLVKCPSQMLKSCSINLATLQNDRIRDFVKVFKQKAILQLKVNETVKFPNKLDTSVNREVWNCRYCDVVFDEDHLEKNKHHLKEIHKILLPSNVQRKEILVKHSDILLVTLNGYKCPKAGCATKPFCSLTGLKFHLTFQHNYDSLRRTFAISNSRNSQLTVGNGP
uniref:C2H2-type domain-containing protein n=1 Tax=Romanomermis culicivorax TaxID=13658 RepID=A0A915L5K0_ROMCU